MCAHIPIRTCIGCGRKTSKYDLLRIVRTDDGRVEPDVESEKSGRGAYLCYNRDCFTKALKRHAVPRHLGVRPPQDFLHILEQTLHVKN